MNSVNKKYKNLYWLVDDNNVYELHSTCFNQDEIVLKFIQDKDDVENYIYTSEILQVEYDDLFAFSIDEAMEQFEDMFIDYIQEKVFYYEDVLEDLID